MNEPRIIHLSFSSEINRHADVTRYNVTEGVGERSIIDVRNMDRLPNADLYVAEYFLSTRKHLDALPDDVKRKSICVVHTAGCLPEGPWGKIVALTHAWKRQLENHLVKVDRVIVPGIDLEPYKNVTPDYAGKTFGRMMRWNAQKIGPDFEAMVKAVLDGVPESRAKFWVSYPEKEDRPRIIDERVTYSGECNIADFKGDHLKELSVYVHANGTFRETLSFAVIEAMATGLPIVYLSEGTGVIEEVVGDAAVACVTMEEVLDTLIAYINMEEGRRYAGKLSRMEAQRFDKNRMVKEFDALIEEKLRR